MTIYISWEQKFPHYPFNFLYSKYVGQVIPHFLEKKINNILKIFVKFISFEIPFAKIRTEKKVHIKPETSRVRDVRS